MKPVRSFGRNYGVQAVTLIALAIVLFATVPSFQGESAIYSTLDGLGLTGIVAAGVSVTMITGELDLSIASMASLAGVVAIRLGGLGLVPAIAIATLVGVVLGGLQGALIARLRISSLVITVASLIVFLGLASTLSGGQPITLANLDESNPILVRIGIFSPPSLIGALVIIGLAIMLARTRWGRQLYAIGGARAEARAAGVPVARSLILAFSISGGCAALGGALASMQGASADPDGFSSLLLAAVAAALIGGVSLYGGRGDGISIALGVLILLLLNAGTAAAGAPSVVTDLLTGVLLIVVIAVDFGIDRLRRARRIQAQRLRVAALESTKP
jgi:ribose/xylose/arabinose/galactoside ABC-type transport system permease subunit